MKYDDQLSIQLTHLDGVAVLELRGALDAFTAPRLRESVEKVCEHDVPVVLDMNLVTFIDSSGVAALIASSGAARGLARSVQIQRPSEQVRRILALAGLDQWFFLEP